MWHSGVSSRAPAAVCVLWTGHRQGGFTQINPSVNKVVNNSSPATVLIKRSQQTTMKRRKNGKIQNKTKQKVFILTGMHFSSLHITTHHDINKTIIVTHIERLKRPTVELLHRENISSYHDWQCLFRSVEMMNRGTCLSLICSIRVQKKLTSGWNWLHSCSLLEKNF